MKKPLVVFYLLLFNLTASAQLIGIKSIPGNYANIAAAITSLNSVGAGTGGVTFSVAAGQIFYSSDLILAAAGSASSPIIFQKSRSGVNPKIIVAVRTRSFDGFIILNRADHIIFDGIDLQESAGNTAGTVQLEWGYAPLKNY